MIIEMKYVDHLSFEDENLQDLFSFEGLEELLESLIGL
jgi:hypothetical protein